MSTKPFPSFWSWTYKKYSFWILWIVYEMSVAWWGYRDGGILGLTREIIWGFVLVSLIYLFFYWMAYLTLKKYKPSR